MATTPLLLVTNAGLNAANGANPQGPWVHIVEFRIGSGFGYEPTRDDTGLNGNTLFTGVPTAYRNIGDNTLDIVCQIPADAGPFEFGEVGIYNEDSSGNKVLFAKAVFDTLQTKYSSLGTNVATSFTFHCLLKLEQSIAIFKVDTLNPMAIVEIDKWSDVLLPAVSPNPDVPLTLVRELDTAGCSSLLHYSVPEQERWTVGTNYTWMANTTVANATANTVSVPIASLNAGAMSTQDTKYVIEIAGRNDPFRVCVSLVATGATATFTIHPDNFLDLPTVGAAVRVYENVNYRSIPLATATTPGIVRAGSGLNVPTPGVFETYGLLHGVQGAGRGLTSADNLNSLALNSGVYHCYGASLPVNSPPVTVGGHIYATQVGGLITQVYWPQKLSAADPITPFWRFFDSGVGGGTWGPWSPMSGGKVGEAGTLTSLGTVNNSSFSQVATKVTSYTITNNRSESHINLYVNGTMLMREDGEGGGSLSITVPIGTAITLSHNGRSENCPMYALTWD
ncbi:MAG: hypothetical protein ACN6OP_25850 [Pseudomonadales bacterium]